jgi:hypothetical protein
MLTSVHLFICLFIEYAQAYEPTFELSSLSGANGFVLNGISEFDDSGLSVSSAGDFNGDGYDDILISAKFGDPNGLSGAGETYLVYGGTSIGSSGIFELSSLSGTNGFVLNGITENDLSGSSVSNAGDFNGDGYDDILIGAINADPNTLSSDAGKTYLVYGGTSVGSSGIFELSSLDGTNGFVLNGITAVDWSGYSVSSAGDFNGDSYDDILIGAYYGDPNTFSDAGETYLVYGGTSVGSNGIFELSSLDGTTGFMLNGITAGDYSGISVSSAGDFNGDSYDDILIGAYRGDPNGLYNAGETYLVYGGTAIGSSGIFELSSLDGTNGFVLNGITAFDNSGLPVSSAGDVNGDGYDDILIGAGSAHPNGKSGAGATYLVYGGSAVDGSSGSFELSSLNGTNGFVLNGVDADDGSSCSVSSAGDFDGDNCSDILIGAYGGSPNGIYAAGETYLVYGGIPSPTPSPTALPTSVPLPAPTSVPIPSPTASPTSVPLPAPTSVPIPSPTSSPTSVPLPVPTSVPIPSPTASPTSVPLPVPTSVPIPSPTASPTSVPLPVPTSVPTPVFEPKPSSGLSSSSASLIGLFGGFMGTILLAIFFLKCVLTKEESTSKGGGDVEMMKRVSSFDPQALPVSRLPTIMGENV